MAVCPATPAAAFEVKLPDSRLVEEHHHLVQLHQSLEDVANARRHLGRGFGEGKGG